MNNVSKVEVKDSVVLGPRKCLQFNHLLSCGKYGYICWDCGIWYPLGYFAQEEVEVADCSSGKCSW